MCVIFGGGGWGGGDGCYDLLGVGQSRHDGVRTYLKLVKGGRVMRTYLELAKGGRVVRTYLELAKGGRMMTSGQ